MTAAARHLRSVPAPPRAKEAPVKLPVALVGRIDERAKRKQLTRVELLEGLFPDGSDESKDPAWRSRLVGIYDDKDERAEREVLGWLLCGAEWPPRFTLRGEHFASRWHRMLFMACVAVRANEGAVCPIAVAKLLRGYGHTQGVTRSIVDLMSEACEVVHAPPFGLFAERAERRLRVLRLERESEELRRELR